MSALEQLAGEVEDVFRVSCRFECREPVLLEDDAVATHLYHIAQEAVHNAIKHGRASNIVIGLAPVGERFVMTIEDDGVGFPENPPPTGMGLHIMSHRAKMVGGTLDVERRWTGGTVGRSSLTKLREYCGFAGPHNKLHDHDDTHKFNYVGIVGIPRIGPSWGSSSFLE